MNLNATLLAQMLVFGVLVWVTMKFIWPPLTKSLDERAKKIADGLAAADRAKLELASANKRVEEQLAQTRDESTRRLADAEKMAHGLIDAAKKKAEEEASKIVAAAKAEADQQSMTARDQLREQVAQLAVKGAEQILRQEIDARKHADLLNRLKAEL